MGDRVCVCVCTCVQFLCIGMTVCRRLVAGDRLFAGGGWVALPILAPSSWAWTAESQ